MGCMSFCRALRNGFLVTVCCVAMPAQGDEIYFSIEGAIQGTIQGDTMQKGLEGRMRALEFEAGVASPFDLASGQKTGKRAHSPVRVTREPGRGTPQLLHALATNESLKEVRFDFYGLRTVSGAKAMSLYQTIKLTNASLVGFERAGVPATDLAGGTVRSLEKLSFTYQKIEIIDVERNVSAQDDWASPLF